MTISERVNNHRVPSSVSKNGASHARAPESGLPGNDFDPLSQYFSEIRDVSLLTAKQEFELGTRVQEGLKARKRLEEYGPSPELHQTIQEGLEARQTFVESNLRLVVSVAKNFVGRGLELPDLIQEGNLGLFRAADRYDPTRGYRFSTYATWWIRQRIIRAIQDQGRTIRLPVHIQDQINKITSARRTLPVSLGREPTDKEVADQLGIGVDRLLEILSYARPPLSLDTPLNPEDDKDNTFGDFIPDRSSSLEEIGEEFGVSRERIRQMEAQALRNLGMQNPELRWYLK